MARSEAIAKGETITVANVKEVDTSELRKSIKAAAIAAAADVANDERDRWIAKSAAAADPDLSRG